MWQNVRKVRLIKYMIRFVLSNKENVIEKLNKNAKQLNSDIENQKELKKKLEETVSEQSKQYNELAKSLFKK